jgi:asparagine synthase (glutamine-hydrolysing)
MPPRLRQALRRLGCRERRSGENLTLFIAAGLEVRSLAEPGGWIIGLLFDKGGRPAPLSLGRHTFDFQQEWIVDRFWGSYVALVANAGEARILRDPSGGLGAYHAGVDGAFYLTSAPHLLIETGVVDAELDWDVIGRSLSQHAERTSQTGLQGISELLPGRAMTIRDTAITTHMVWDPWVSAGRDLSTEPAATLEEILTSTLAAWGRSTQRPLIEVSGGLDSAIVAAGVAAAAPEASLVSFAAAAGDPDESLYARALADHLGLRLEMRRPNIDDVDLTRSMSRDLPRPNARAFVQAADLQSLRHAEAIGADAFFSGGGGDDVFGYLRTIRPALDRLGAEGFRGMLKTSFDVALMNHATLWDALWRVARRWIGGRTRKPGIDRRLLAVEMSGGGSGSEFSGPGGRPGKVAHVEAVLSIHNYLEGHARAQFAPIHSPLLSQPIVECCLSIPTWLWCTGGRNRAVARDAFARRLPAILLARRSKGSFDGFCAQLFHARRELISDLLIDGILARHGLIDRDQITLAVRDPYPPVETIGRLLALADAESWASGWNVRLVQRG